MAARQQHKMDQQQQLLVAKEQRLKFLKQQEQKHQQAALGQGQGQGQGGDRLRRMRGRVEVLEAKLRKIRAQRGDAVQMVDSNATLASELESMKSLFFEKEKELASAVSRVEELSRQLEEARMGRVKGNTENNSSAADDFVELEKLRKDLMIRNKQNEQQNSALAAQHAILKQRKEEMTDLNQKIAELKLRLKNKKKDDELTDKVPVNGDPAKAKSSSGPNIVAVEPFKHNHKDADEDTKFQSLPRSLKLKEDITSKESKTDKPRKSFFDSLVANDSAKLEKAGEAGDVPTKTVPNGTDTVDSSLKPSESVTGVARKATPPSYQSVMGLAAKQGSHSSYSKEMPPPPNTKAEVPTTWPEVTTSTRISSLMTNFAPRPYGSTFSSSGGGVGKTPGITMSTSILSSPTSGGQVPSPKTSTPVGATDPSSGHGRPTTQPVSESHAVTNFSSSQSQRVGQPVVTQHGVISTGPPSSLVSSNTTNTQESSKESPGAVAGSAMARLNPAVPSVSVSEAPAKEHSPGSAVARLLNSSAATTGVNSKPQYASKSVIANTYMRRLSPNALDQYRKNMSQIYQGLGSNLGPRTDSNSSESPTARVRPMNMELPTHAAGVDSNPHNSANSPYNIDPVKFRPNVTRVHRRRSSSGDSPQSVDRRVPIQHHGSEDDDVFAQPSEGEPDPVPGRHTPVLPPDLLSGSVHQIKVTHSSTRPDEGPQAGKEHHERLPFVLRRKKGNLKSKNSSRHSRRVSFDPLALLLDASLEGELELVKKSAHEVPDPSCPNDEGITALHNAICAGHYEIVKFLVEYGCNVNAPDSDGWTPLHCAASCNNLQMVKVLVEHGACIFATTISDQETACAKCEEDEDGFEGCSEYLYNVQEKLGVMNNGVIYAVFDYKAQNTDELDFVDGDKLTVLRKGDETESEWWWARRDNSEGYIPRNLFGLFPRKAPQWLKDSPKSDKSRSDR